METDLSKDEIDELESLLQLELPLFYRTFLQAMGRSSGPIKFLFKDNVKPFNRPMEIRTTEIDVTFSSVLNYHRGLLNRQKRKAKQGKRTSSPGSQHGSLFLFGLNPKGNDTGHFYFDLAESALPVFEVTETLGNIPRGNSLLEFLFLDSFPDEVRRAANTRHA